MGAQNAHPLSRLLLGYSRDEFVPKGWATRVLGGRRGLIGSRTGILRVIWGHQTLVLLQIGQHGVELLVLADVHAEQQIGERFRVPSGALPTSGSKRAGAGASALRRCGIGVNFDFFSVVAIPGSIPRTDLLTQMRGANPARICRRADGGRISNSRRPSSY